MTDAAPAPAPRHVQVDEVGAARWIRLTRPEKRNAMTRAMAADLRGALEAAAGDDGVRAVVLTGSGGWFSSGADTTELFGRRADRGPDGERDRAGEGASGAMLTEARERPVFPVDELVLFPKPTIAALDGPAVGGGATMAMACDLRVAADAATLAFSLGRVGLTPEWGSSYLLWRQIGWSRALDVLLTGRTVTAAEALDLGLVNRVVAADALDGAVADLVEVIGALPPGTAEATKEVLREGLDATYPDARRAELRMLGRRAKALAADRGGPDHPESEEPSQS